MKKALTIFLCLLFFGIAFQFKTATAETKSTVLKMAMYQPATHILTKFFRSMMPEVEKITKGRVKIKIYDSSSLLNARGMDPGVNKGIADIGLSYPPTQASSITFLSIADLPGIIRDVKGFNDALDNGLTELYEQAYHQGGMQNLKVIGLANLGFWYIATSKKEFHIPSDLKGLKIAGAGRMHTKYINDCGSTGVYLPVIERYEALERGIVDGVTGYTSNFVSWKWMEPANFFLDFGIGSGAISISVNKNSIEKKVPKDLQEPVLRILRLIVLNCRGMYAAASAHDYEYAMLNNMNSYKPTPSEQKLWIDAGQPFISNWLSKTGSLGKKALNIVEKYNAR